MITLYRGSRGKGKTLTMVKDAYVKFKQGYRVISNLSLSFGEYMGSSELLALNRDSLLYNCVLVLDEIQLFFDSRSFSKPQSKDFSHFLQQIRKRNIHILFTTQYINTVDLRIRQQIDFVIQPHHYDEGYVVCYVYDLTLLEDGLEDISPSIVVYDAKPYYLLYDSYEMLK